MAGIEFVDNTGKPLTPRDFEECIDTVTRSMGLPMMKIAAICPELAVLLPSIRRCLVQGQKLTEAFDRMLTEQGVKPPEGG